MTIGGAGSLLPHSVDSFLGGRVTLLQPKTGHRAGLDAALLQALLPTEATGHAVDLGSGVGTIAFSAAARATALSVAGVEADGDLVALARAALKLPQNAEFAGRVTMVSASVEESPGYRDYPQLAKGGADWVLMNPPFDTHGAVRASPQPQRRNAHVAAAGLLALWCGVAATLLRPGGMLGLVHRAPALPEVLEALRGDFGAVHVVPVHASIEKPAGRIIVRAKRGSRGPLTLAPGLILHRADGAWTPQADALLKGRGTLAV